MQQSVHNDNQAVIDLLAALRRERFSLAGWWNFIKRSWQMSYATADAHPQLKHSWLRATLFITLLTIGILALTLRIEGARSMFQLLPGFAFCIVWQQSDLFWHLGLNRHPQTGNLFPRLGIANICTLVRGLCASFLLGRLVGGLPSPAELTLLVFLTGTVTDILDGQLARYTRMHSKLGQIMDGEADFCLYLAVTIILLQNTSIPLWLAAAMLLRFCLPLLAAIGSYFLLARPVRFGSTTWGKYAGVAQFLYFLILLTPPLPITLIQLLTTPLLVLTLLLLIVAPIAQIKATFQSRKLVKNI